MRWGTGTKFFLWPLKADTRLWMPIFAQAPLCLASQVCWPPLLRQDLHCAQTGLVMLIFQPKEAPQEFSPLPVPEGR